MSFLSVLGKIAKAGETVAPAAVTAINPAAGAITGIVLNAVVKAEQAGGTGASKKQQVMNQVLPAIVPLISTVAKSTGTQVNLNSTGANNAVSQIVDGVVALLNAVEAPTAATTGS